MPLTALVGVDEKADPLHADAVIELTDGTGLTVTVTVNALLTQLPVVPEVAVTLYVTVATALLVLVNCWLIEVWPDNALAPVTVLTGLIVVVPQLYVVDAGTI